MRAILVQLDIQWHNAEANFANVRSLLEAESIPEGSLIVLPELFAVGFTMNLEAATAGEPDRTASFLHEIADEYESCVVGGLATRADNPERGFNQALAVAPGGAVLSTYRKRRLFRYTGEDAHYHPGSDSGIFPFGGLHIQPLICYDLRFPELFREGVARGAEAHLVIANWPDVRQEHWTTLLQARAIENQAYVIGCNRAGSDPALTYAGGSQVFDPMGEPLCSPLAGEGTISAEIDPLEVTAWREEFPALRDARNT